MTIANYFIEDLKNSADLEYNIPFSMMPESLICCSYSNHKLGTASLFDNIYMEIQSFFGDFMRMLHNIYGLTHVFTEPMLIYSPCKKECTLKIGMMSQKEFEEINEILEKRETRSPKSLRRLYGKRKKHSSHERNVKPSEQNEQ